jgi:hypothetical protein
VSCGSSRPTLHLALRRADRALDVAYRTALDAVRPTIDATRSPDAVKEIDEAIAKLPPATK